jgi:hypothetical protein
MPPAVPTTPAGIPRDPLPGSAEAPLPIAFPMLLLGIGAPFICLLCFWLWLAIQRAKETDPVRPRRDARARLARTLARLQAANGTERAELLLAWQRDAAVLWQLRHAAPRATALPDSAWSILWAEADRALYGAENALPTDWVTRAQQALAAKRVPGFKARRMFLPQNLMPFAALVAVGVVATTAALRAAEFDGMTAYRKGDFAAAEKSWRDASARRPTDWIARHNLALALAQQERTGEAAAQAAAAFVQKPDDPSVRWHFGLIAEKAGVAPATLITFISPGPLQSLGRLMSASYWQRLLISCCWLSAAGLGLLLRNAYRRRSRTAQWAAVGLIGFSFLLGSSALAGVKSYGLAANADAVVVARPNVLRSIPTEADTTQKTSPLSAGSIALADKTFLGWTRLAFDNGQTGWVRKDDIVPLWK